MTTHRHYLYSALLLFCVWFSACTQNSSPPSGANELTVGVSQGNTPSNNVWTSPIEIDSKIIDSADAPKLNVQLSLSGTGDAFIIWQALHPPALGLTIPPEIKWRPSGELAWSDNTPLIDVSDDSASRTVATSMTMHTHSITGIVYAIWQRLATEVTGHDESYISRYEPASGWGPSLKMGDLLVQPTIVFDSDGDATLLWLRRNENGTIELHAKRYTKAQGLSAMHSLVRGQVNTPQYFSITALTGVTDDLGNTEVYWWESQASQNGAIPSQTGQLWYSQFSLDSGWQSPQGIAQSQLTLSTAIEHIHYVPALDSNQAVFVLARKSPFNPQVSSIHAMHYRDEVWDLAQRIDHEGIGEAVGLDIASNDRGEIAVAWSQLVNIPQTKIETFVRRYTPEQAWLATQLVSTVVLSSSDVTPSVFASQVSLAPNVVINQQGDIIVAWLDPSQIRHEIFVNQFSPTTGWSGRAIAVNTQLTYETFSGYDIAHDNAGNTTLAWQSTVHNTQSTSYRTMISDHLTSSTPLTRSMVPRGDPTTLIAAKNRPLSGEIITQSDVWSIPEIIWKSLDFNTKTDYLTIPSFIGRDDGKRYLSLRAELTFDSQRLSFQRVDNLLLVDTVNLPDWQHELPSLNASDKNSREFQLVNDVLSDVTFLAWLKNNVLYINHQHKDSSLWSTQQQVANNVSRYWLLTNRQGKTVLVWQAIHDATFLSASYLTDMVSGLLNIQPPVTVDLPDGQPMSQPVIDSQGRVAIAWLLTQSMMATPTLQVARLFADGWENPRTQIRVDNMDLGFALLSPAAGDNLLLIVRNEQERQLYASRLARQGGWSPWENLDQNNGEMDVVMGRPRLVYNQRGDVMVLWVEEMSDAEGNFSHRIFSSSYQGIADEDGRFWSSPAMLGHIGHPNYYATPQLVLDEDGLAAAVWSHRNHFQSSILANKYSPENGWLAKPERVALSAGLKKLSLLSSNEISVVWQTYATPGNTISTLKVSNSEIKARALPTPEPPITGGNWYRPTLGTRWQWQLQGTLNTTYPVDIYDIDLFDTPSEVISALKAQQRKVICYFSAGSYEPWRADAERFQEDDLGPPLEGYPDERWLDIRSSNVLAILQDRINLAKEKNCDGVEPDNVDVYLSSPALGISAEEQLTFNRWLANEAHKLDLAVALKNDLGQVAELIDYFDFSINEQCHVFNECELLQPFIEAGKPVLNAEYDEKYTTEAGFSQLCASVKTEKFQTLVLSVDLDDSLRLSCDALEMGSGAFP